MRFKIAGIALIISSIIWIIIECYYLGKSFSKENWLYYKNHLFDVFFPFCVIFVPISLIIFAKALLKTNSIPEIYEKKNELID